MPSEYALTFTRAEILLLDRALGALPYKDVAALIARINEQIQEQEQGPQDDKRER